MILKIFSYYKNVFFSNLFFFIKNKNKKLFPKTNFTFRDLSNELVEISLVN